MLKSRKVISIIVVAAFLMQQAISAPIPNPQDYNYDADNNAYGVGFANEFPNPMDADYDYTKSPTQANYIDNKSGTPQPQDTETQPQDTETQPQNTENEPLDSDNNDDDSDYENYMPLDSEDSDYDDFELLKPEYSGSEMIKKESLTYAVVASGSSMSHIHAYKNGEPVSINQIPDAVKNFKPMNLDSFFSDDVFGDPFKNFNPLKFDPFFSDDSFGTDMFETNPFATDMFETNPFATDMFETNPFANDFFGGDPLDMPFSYFM